MIIQQNIPSLNINNRLTQHNKKADSILEKLSSGYKINRAGDDAAGLAISEKMRGQIRGLNMAGKNIQDGISLIQTAEGAMNEIHSVLQRGRELAIQAANDTLTYEDRLLIQKETEQIKDGLNKIVNNTEFNGIKLLNNTIKLGSGNNLGIYEDTLSLIDITTAESVTFSEYTNGVYNKITYTMSEIESGVYYSPPNNSAELYYFGIITQNGRKSIYSRGLTTNGEHSHNIAYVQLNGIKNYDVVQLGANTGTGAWLSPGQSFEVGHHYLMALDDDPLTYTKVDESTSHLGDSHIFYNFSAHKKIDSNTNNGNSKSTLKIQIGANSINNIEINLPNLHIDEIEKVNISSQQDSNKAISIFDNVINLISKERTMLGAYYNRLEHAHQSVMNTSENLQSAESRIRDTDMAKEMMAFTKNNILLQATQSMLAQSNKQPEGILQLLQ